MDFITYLTKKTLKVFNVNAPTITEVLSKNHYIKINNLIQKHRNKEVQTNAEIILQLTSNGLTLFYSEILKYIIVLSIAQYFSILLPVFFVMTIFTLLRPFAGGVHLSTFNKCFGAMIFFFLSLGWLVTQIHINIVYILIGYILSLYLAYKYAPQEREDKSDKDCDDGNIKKHKSMWFVVLSCVISVILFKHYQLISLSIFAGVLLEISTITPIGTQFFKWIDGGIK